LSGRLVSGGGKRFLLAKARSTSSRLISVSCRRAVSASGKRIARAGISTGNDRLDAART